MTSITHAIPSVNANLKSLPAPAPINRPRPCDCPEAPESEHCGSSGWQMSLVDRIIAGKRVDPDEIERDLRACQQLINTIDRLSRVYPEPTEADRRWAAEVMNANDPGHALDEVSPATDGLTPGMLGLLAYEDHREAERRYQDWCEGR